MHNKSLPPSLLLTLYKDSLVIPGTTEHSKGKNISNEVPIAPAEKITSADTTIRFLGENKKRIAVLVHTVNYPYLSDNSLELLTKMLGACGLNMEDIALVNEYNTKQDWHVIQEQLKPNVAIFFGSKVWQMQLPFAMPHYQVQPHGATVYLTAPHLDNLDGNSDTVKSEKQKLWLALQKIFKKNNHE